MNFGGEMPTLVTAGLDPAVNAENQQSLPRRQRVTSPQRWRQSGFNERIVDLPFYATSV
jgi:hypothetical protein